MPCSHNFYGRLPTRQNYVPRTSCGRPEDVLWTSLKDILWMSPYGLLCNANARPLPTSRGRPLHTSFGRWNMTSWERANVTSWECPHNVLYLTPRELPCRRLEDVSCRRYDDFPIWSHLKLHGTYPTDVLRTPLRDILKTSLYGSIINAEKRVRDKEFCTWS